jgi:hypothetical protein
LLSRGLLFLLKMRASRTAFRSVLYGFIDVRYLLGAVQLQPQDR